MRKMKMNLTEEEAKLHMIELAKYLADIKETSMTLTITSKERTGKIIIFLEVEDKVLEEK